MKDKNTKRVWASMRVGDQEFKVEIPLVSQTIELKDLEIVLKIELQKEILKRFDHTIVYQEKNNYAQT